MSDGGPTGPGWGGPAPGSVRPRGANGFGRYWSVFRPGTHPARQRRHARACRFEAGPYVQEVTLGKRVQFDEAARRALWRGVDQLASAVRITLGPRGRSVVLHRLHGVPTITRDGLAVAAEIELADPFENLGVQMLREVAHRTGETAGDGTTTATVIAHRIVGDGLKAVAAGGNPVAIKRGIERATAEAIRAIAEQARPVDDARDLVRVATLAAGDHVLGERIAEAIERVRRHGVVTVEEGRGLDVTLEMVEGVRFEGGYTSPYFVTDADDMEAQLDHPLVLLVDAHIHHPSETVSALEHAASQSRPLCLICSDIDPEALSVLVINRLRGTVPSVCVKVVDSVSRRRELFEDLALLTGATLVTPETGQVLQRCVPEWFGRARHVTAGAEQTTLLQGAGRTSDVRSRLSLLRREHDAAEHAFEREALRNRLSRLAGGVAMIKVGAATDVEREAIRSRLEDALASTRAAIEEGVVAGGGIALLRAADRVRAMRLAPAEQPGRDIVCAALMEPARQIAINAGEDGDVVITKLREAPANIGYNAVTGTYGDMMAEGILDPAKVTRLALQHAASLGGLVLTTDAIVVDDEAGDAA